MSGPSYCGVNKQAIFYRLEGFQNFLEHDRFVLERRCQTGQFDRRGGAFGGQCHGCSPSMNSSGDSNSESPTSVISCHRARSQISTSSIAPTITQSRSRWAKERKSSEIAIRPCLSGSTREAPAPKDRFADRWRTSPSSDRDAIVCAMSRKRSGVSRARQPSDPFIKNPLSSKDVRKDAGSTIRPFASRACSNCPTNSSSTSCLTTCPTSSGRNPCDLKARGS